MVGLGATLSTAFLARARYRTFIVIVQEGNSYVAVDQTIVRPICARPHHRSHTRSGSRHRHD